VTPLQERLATLKESTNPRTYSDTPNSLPLSTFLILYEKANHECYINYMQGAIALHSYLTSSNKYPLTMSPTSGKVPRLLITYELNELVKILAGSLDLNKQDVAERCIYKEIAEL